MSTIPFDMEWASDADREAYEHDVLLYGMGIMLQRDDGTWEHKPLEESQKAKAQ